MAKLKVRQPTEIAKDGFRLPDTKRHLEGFALLSLRIAMWSYFSTYRSMAHYLYAFTDKDIRRLDDTDYLHSTDFCSLCGQTLIHFQHFAELVCKDFLRTEHELLASDASNKPLLLLKLLKGEALKPDETENLYAVEFSVALRRVRDLLEAGRLDARFKFVEDAASLLEQLNHLRNRLLHGGTFVLRYPALDELVGAHILPFIRQVVALPEYAKHERFWKYGKLKCCIDPMDEIAADWKTGKYDVKKVALLKELGRAAYEGPARDELFLEQLTSDDRRRAERAAAFEVEKRIGAAAQECPVCGANSLLRYDDSDVEYDDDNNPQPGELHPYMHRCLCCSFEVDYHLDNPRDYGLAIADFW